MSWQDAHDSADRHKIAVVALEIIEGLLAVAEATGVPAAGAIRAVLKTVKDGMSGATSPEVVLAELKAIHDTLSTNDAVIEERIKSKPE